MFPAETADAYIWNIKPEASVIFGYTKNHLKGDVEADMKKALTFTKKDFGVAWMNQEHGPAIITIDSPGRYMCDGLLTRSQGLALVVRTADCMPLILYGEKQGVLGAVHMGWRSAKAGILDNMPFDLSEVICIAGVGMRKCCYEVGMEFLGYGEIKDFLEKRKDLYYFDPIGYAREKLLRRGLKKENFFDQNECSFCSERGFHSYRKTKTPYRTLTFIVGYE